MTLLYVRASTYVRATYLRLHTYPNIWKSHVAPVPDRPHEVVVLLRGVQRIGEFRNLGLGVPAVVMACGSGVAMARKWPGCGVWAWCGQYHWRQ